MCGIFILLDGKLITVGQLEGLFKQLDRRGPDYSSPVTEIEDGPLKFYLKSSVLHLRGDVMQQQPVIDDNGNALMFNGQIYKYRGQPIGCSLSDTSFLSRELDACETAQQVASVFAHIEGPFAFIYWQASSKSLIYGRDLFGRKSLCGLWRGGSSMPTIISSVAYNIQSPQQEIMGETWSEISCSGLHCIEYGQHQEPRTYTFRWNLDRIYPRTEKCQLHDDIPIGQDRLPLDPDLEPLNGDLKQPDAFDEGISTDALDELEGKFLDAVRSRFQYNNKTCLSCRRSQTKQCHHAKVAVAFSGGIDSTLIALALDKIIDISESIDLVTVAFKTDSPDRASVGCAYEELVKLSPDRNWRLITCDIDVQELSQRRTQTIRDLILPCNSVFDDGIGCASWFVSRARGRAIDKTTSREWFLKNYDTFLEYDPLNKCVYENGAMHYTSPASMIYVGSSIDEQLGGYSSHLAAWTKLGAKGLVDEISFLMRRLSTRNLGRDDRTYSDHGRDPKLPFLDFGFVSFLNQLPIGLKMNLNEQPASGPKKILRLLALRWGLDETGRRVKRAMQFGTRIANLEAKKEKGDEVCVRLQQHPAS